MMNSSILITGASGFTGRHACRHFQQLGMKVTALVHEPSPDLAALGVAIVACDLLEARAVATAIQEVQPSYVLHLGGINSVPLSWRHPLHTFQVNVLGTLNVLDALRLLPATRALVVTSKLKAQLGSTKAAHPYACSKAVQEMAALAWSRLFQLDIVLAEPSNLIGPGPSTGICALLAQQVCRQEQGLADGSFTLSSRNVARDYLDVRDAVAAYEKLLLHAASGRAYAVQSGVVRSLGEVADAYSELTQAKLSFRWQEEHAPASSAQELQQTPESLQRLESATVEGLPASWGWQPAISFRQSLIDCLHYYRNRELS